MWVNFVDVLLWNTYIHASGLLFYLSHKEILTRLTYCCSIHFLNWTVIDTHTDIAHSLTCTHTARVCGKIHSRQRNELRWKCPTIFNRFIGLNWCGCRELRFGWVILCLKSKNEKLKSKRWNQNWNKGNIFDSHLDFNKFSVWINTFRYHLKEGKAFWTFTDCYTRIASTVQHLLKRRKNERNVKLRIFFIKFSNRTAVVQTDFFSTAVYIEPPTVHIAEVFFLFSPQIFIQVYFLWFFVNIILNLFNFVCAAPE